MLRRYFEHHTFAGPISLEFGSDSFDFRRRVSINAMGSYVRGSFGQILQFNRCLTGRLESVLAGIPYIQFDSLRVDKIMPATRVTFVGKDRFYCQDVKKDAQTGQQPDVIVGESLTMPICAPGHE